MGRFTTLLVFAVLATAVYVAPAHADGTGTVIVINDSDFTLDIHVDGSKRFRLEPGTRRAVDRLEPGNHSFRALTPSGQTKFQKQMRVAAGQKLSWILKWSRADARDAMPRRAPRPEPATATR